MAVSYTHLAKEYVKNFDKSCKNKSIIFVGQVGSGKTHLSMAIANSLMEKGVGVLYMPYRDNIISCLLYTSRCV